MVGTDITKRLGAAFPDSIINTNLEFIADPHRRVNSYFILANCETEEDVIAKLLEWLSREAYKSQHFDSESRNKQVHRYHRMGINRFCGTDFTEMDMRLIYTYLGNRCNHEKTLRFIRSGYDMLLLQEKGEKPHEENPHSL